jgi:hypothetical protein
MVLSPLLEDTSSMGTGIRIILTGSVSVLASVGFYKFHSVGQDIFNKKGDVLLERPLRATS